MMHPGERIADQMSPPMRTLAQITSPPRGGADRAGSRFAPQSLGVMSHTGSAVLVALSGLKLGDVLALPNCPGIPRYRWRR
jgi:hypothetical protein